MLKNKKFAILIFIFFFLTQLCYSATVNSEMLLNAVRQNDVDAVRQCLRKGISPNSQDSMGNSALLISISMGYSNIATVLIKNGGGLYPIPPDAEGIEKITDLLL